MTRLTKLMLSISIALLSYSTSIASKKISLDVTNPRVVITNWGNPMGEEDGEVCVEVYEDDMLYIDATITVADNNLDNYPPIYMSYYWGGHLVGEIGPITDVDLKEETYTSLSGTTTLYSASFNFPIQLNKVCSPPEPTEGLVDFTYTLSLTTRVPNGGGVTTVLAYPVLTYPALFPPLIFEEITEPGFIPSYSKTKNLCCRSGNNPNTFAQINSEFDTRFESRGLGDNASNGVPQIDLGSYTETNTSINEVNVFPNPVANDLNIELDGLQGEFYQIDLIGLNGEIIQSIYRDTQGAGNYKEVMDTEGLPKGVFFCRVSAAEFSKTIKVIKT